MSIPSIRKRYFYTLLSNIVRLLAGVVTISVVPKALGPSNYGDFNFLLQSFKSIRGLFGLSTNNAFFNYNSKSPKTNIVVVLYSLFLLIQAVGVAGLISVCLLLGYAHYLWPGQEAKYLWLVAGLEFLIFVSQQAVLFGDSKGRTVYTRMLSLLVYFAGTILTLLLFFLDNLSLNTFIFTKYFIAVSSCAILISYYYKQRTGLFSVLRWNKEQIVELIRYFYSYCSPLVMLTIAGLSFTYFDRWLLQFLQGSSEQGYYSISFQWSAIVLLFTTSVIHIYWKECASAYESGDKKRIVALYTKVSFFLYGMSCCIAAFVFINASKLVMLFGGTKYTNAGIPFMIMAFYPIHQTYGQLNGTLFQATRRNKIHRNIGISGHLLGLLLTYILLAPGSYIVPGFNLGATGLAIKMVAIQVVMINIQILCNTRFLKINYMAFFFQQVKVVVIYMLLGVTSLYLSQRLLGFCAIKSDLILIGAHGIVYLLICGGLIYKFPSINGITKQDIRDFKDKIFAMGRRT